MGRAWTSLRLYRPITRLREQLPHRLFLAEITAGQVRHCGFVLTGHWASQYGKWFRAHQSGGKERLPCC